MVKFSIKTSLLVLFADTVSEAGASVLVVPWFFADKEGGKEGRKAATRRRRGGALAVLPGVFVTRHTFFCLLGSRPSFILSQRP